MDPEEVLLDQKWALLDPKVDSFDLLKTESSQGCTSRDPVRLKIVKIGLQEVLWTQKDLLDAKLRMRFAPACHRPIRK